MVRAPLTFSIALVAFGAVACGHNIGDDCKTSVDCSQAGERLCDITQPGGYCTVFNCEPNTCPSEAACVVFDPQLSAVAECKATNGLSRFARSFCLFRCDSNGDCRDGYVCQDFSREEPNDWNGLAVDTDRSGKVCVARRDVQSVHVDSLPPTNVCDGPPPSGGATASGGSPSASGGSSGAGGSSGLGGAAGAGGAEAGAGGAGG